MVDSFLVIANLFVQYAHTPVQLRSRTIGFDIKVRVDEIGVILQLPLSEPSCF